MLPERFWAKVLKTPDCWVWQAGLRCGYGQFSFNGKPQQAHILSFKSAGGKLTRLKYMVLHKCGNRKCVNPAHLYAGDHADNIKDAIRGGTYVPRYRNVTHCIRGHAFDKKNTRYYTSKCGGAGRACRACNSFYPSRRKVK